MKATIFKERAGGAVLKITLFNGMKGSEKPEDFSRLIERDKGVGFAGFRERNALTRALGFHGVAGTSDWVDVEVAKENIQKTIGKCIKAAPMNDVRVFVFPTKDDFIRKSMGGVSGDCFWKNTILVFLHEEFNPNDLSRAVAHEFAHAYSLNHMKRETLQEYMVFEGVAEIFVLSVMGGRESPWAVALKRDESMKIFHELREKMNSRSRPLYREVFFGGGEYPMWAGYSVGYHLVSDYLKGAGCTGWADLLKRDTKEIVKKSGWS